jgi:hypothetical protein
MDEVVGLYTFSFYVYGYEISEISLSLSLLSLSLSLSMCVCLSVSLYTVYNVFEKLKIQKCVGMCVQSKNLNFLIRDL